MVDFSKYLSNNVFDGIRPLSKTRAEHLRRRFVMTKEQMQKAYELYYSVSALAMKVHLDQPGDLHYTAPFLEAEQRFVDYLRSLCTDPL